MGLMTSRSPGAHRAGVMQRRRHGGGATQVGERPGVVEAAAQVGILKLPDLGTEVAQTMGERA